MYAQPRETSVNRVRVKMLNRMVGDDFKLTSNSKIDLAKIPPCLDSLVPHCQRVNYRVACYKHAHIPFVEKPKPFDKGQGWEKLENGSLEAVWSRGPILPLSLIDILEGNEWNIEEEEEDICLDYETMFEDDDNEDGEQ